MKFKLNLQMFGEEEGAAATAPATAETATAAENGTEFTVNAGDTLPDGQPVSSQVAAAMNKQMARHPELKQVYGQNLKRNGKRTGATPSGAYAPPSPEGTARGTADGSTGAQTAEKSIEERWNEAKKGEFAEFYGRDVQSAIQDRFRNQADANEQLKAANEQLHKLEPMLKVLMDRGEFKDVDELIHHVMDDDSLYEEAASEAGMTVEAYKQFKEIERQRNEMAAREQQNIQEQRIREHYGKLCQQAEGMKAMFPDFDLTKELKDPQFFRMTSIEGGISVEDAYFAIHHKELAPQMLAYGMERAKQQMGQTLQAQRRRPAEGAMKTQGQPAAADFNIDPRSLSRPERNRIYELIHKGKMQWG